MKKIKFLAVVLTALFSMPMFAQFTSGGSSSKQLNNYGESILNTGQRGIIDFGYGVGVGDVAEGRVEIATTHGYQ